MSKLICRFLGHERSKYLDMGDMYCARCSAHPYYEEEEWRVDWLWPPLRWWIEIRWRWEEYQRERRLKKFDPDKDCPF